MTDLKNRIVFVGEKAADQFTGHPNNPRVHSRYQRAVVKGLLDKLGWVGLVMESKRTGYLLDGHDRIFQALAYGDETPVPYYIVDVSEDEERLILAAYDASGALAHYDAGQVADLMNKIQTGDSAVESLLRSVAERAIVPIHPFLDPANPNNSESLDRAAYDRFKPALGDIWLIGPHTLAVMDSAEFQYSRNLTPRLTMMYLDMPPAGRNVPINDDFRGSVYTTATPGLLSLMLQNMRADANKTGFIVWHKGANLVTTPRAEWADSAQLIAYAMTPGAVFNMPAYAPASNVWTIAPDLTPLTPDAQPVGLLVRMIAASTAPGDAVLDLFAGSGPAFVAAHMLGRRCIGYEIDPVRAAIILDRMAGLGLMPERVAHD